MESFILFSIILEVLLAGEARAAFLGLAKKLFAWASSGSPQILIFKEGMKVDTSDVESLWLVFSPTFLHLFNAEFKLVAGDGTAQPCEVRRAIGRFLISIRKAEAIAKCSIRTYADLENVLISYIIFTNWAEKEIVGGFKDDFDNASLLLLRLQEAQNLVSPGTLADTSVVDGKTLGARRGDFKQIKQFNAVIRGLQAKIAAHSSSASIFFSSLAAKPLSVGPTTVLPEFDVDNVDVLLEMITKFGKDAVSKRLKEIRLGAALKKTIADVKSTFAIPSVKISIPEPPKEFSWFARELFFQIFNCFDGGAVESVFKFVEEEIKSDFGIRLHVPALEVLLAEITKVTELLDEAREQVKKHPENPALPHEAKVIEAKLAHLKEWYNSSMSNKAFRAAGLVSHKLPAYEYKFACRKGQEGVLKSLLRQWRLTISEIIPNFDFTVVTAHEFETHVPTEVFEKGFDSNVKSLPTALMNDLLNLRIVSQDLLKDLCNKIVALGEVAVKNHFQLADYPEAIQALIKSGKNSLEGVKKAITFCQQKLADSKLSQQAKVFAEACALVSSAQLGRIMSYYSVAKEVDLPEKVQMAITHIMNSNKDKIDENLTLLSSGGWNLDQYKIEVPKAQPTMSWADIAKKSKGLPDSSKAAAKALITVFSDALIVLWNIMFPKEVLPAWVQNAWEKNENFARFLIENCFINEGLTKSDKFKLYKPTTPNQFLRDFYKVKVDAFVYADLSLEDRKFIQTVVRDGRMFTIFRGIDEQRNSLADGSKTDALFQDLSEIKSKVSKVSIKPAGRKNKSAKGEGSTGGTGKSKGTAGAKSSAGVKKNTPKQKSGDKKKADNKANKPSTPANKSGPSGAKPKGGAKSGGSKSGGKSSSNKIILDDAIKSVEKVFGKGAKKSTGGKSAPGKTAPKSDEHRSVLVDGKSVTVAEIQKKIKAAKDKDSDKIVVGNNQFSVGFISKLLANKSVERIGSRFDSGGKFKPYPERKSE